MIPNDVRDFIPSYTFHSMLLLGPKPAEIEQLIRHPHHNGELRDIRLKFNNFYFEEKFVVMDLVRHQYYKTVQLCQSAPESTA